MSTHVFPAFLFFTVILLVVNLGLLWAFVMNEIVIILFCVSHDRCVFCVFFHSSRRSTSTREYVGSIHLNPIKNLSPSIASYIYFKQKKLKIEFFWIFFQVSDFGVAEHRLFFTSQHFIRVYMSKFYHMTLFGGCSGFFLKNRVVSVWPISPGGFFDHEIKTEPPICKRVGISKIWRTRTKKLPK